MSNQTSAYGPPRQTVWQSGVQPPGTQGVPNQSSSFRKLQGIQLVREVDGSPSVAAEVLEVSNGTLSEPSPGVARVVTGAGAGGGASRLGFRHFVVTAASAAGETFNVQTGLFSGTGTSVVYAGYGTPVLPADALEFRDDERLKIWRNGNLQTKGAGKEVEFASTTELVWLEKMQIGDELVVISPESFA